MGDKKHLKELVKYLKNKGYGNTQQELADKLGYGRSSFSQIINGKVPVSKPFVKNITNLESNINIHWLYTGEGEMFIKEYEVEENPVIVSETEIPYHPNLSRGNATDQQTVKLLLEYLEKAHTKNNELSEEIGKLKYQVEVLKKDQV